MAGAQVWGSNLAAPSCTIYSIQIIHALSIDSRFPRAGLPVCGNWSSLALYSRAVHAVARLARHQLTRDTGCVMPCSFMEYKVKPSHIVQCFSALG